jgi:signal transduction histidine kinase
MININLGHDYRKSLAIEALNLIQEKLKDSKKKYDELFRMTESYIKHLHAAEAENKRLKEAAKIYIADVAEYGESFCNAVGHNPETCNECILKGLIK